MASKMNKIQRAFSAGEARGVALLIGVAWYAVVSAGRHIMGSVDWKDPAKYHAEILKTAKEQVVNDVADLLAEVEHDG